MVNGYEDTARTAHLLAYGIAAGPSVRAG
jgi:hypothetical protein